MSNQVYEFTYKYKDDATYTYTFTHEFENKEVRGEVHVKKIDKDTNDFVSQGNASLDGAVYGLYAAEDIIYPNKKRVLSTEKMNWLRREPFRRENWILRNYILENIMSKRSHLGKGIFWTKQNIRLR